MFAIDLKIIEIGFRLNFQPVTPLLTASVFTSSKAEPGLSFDFSNFFFFLLVTSAFGNEYLFMQNLLYSSGFGRASETGGMGCFTSETDCN
jgi:hypothetical protein